MKYFSAVLIALALGSAMRAEDKEQPTVKGYEQPALLTSVGQAADVLIMKGLCLRAGVNVTLEKTATADSLKEYKALILVAGGSSKGLGAAKVDVSQEEKRCQALVDAAKKAKIPVIAFHIGGETRRGALSDGFNKLAADNAEALIVASDGDLDSLFLKTAEKNKARYIHIDKQIEAVDILKQLFPPEKKEE